MNILFITTPLFIEQNKKITLRFPPYLILSTAAQLEKIGFSIKIYDAHLENTSLKEIKNAVDRSVFTDNFQYSASRKITEHNVFVPNYY